MGGVSALYGVTPYTLTDGLAGGVRAFDVKNGNGVEMTVLADRGLDIPFLRYKGVNVGFYSKTGVTHPAYYQEEGVRGFLKRFYGGLLTTCGITYAGAPCDDEGRTLGLHGPFSNTPAEAVSAGVVYEGDDVALRIAGQVREACIFEENLRMSRELVLETERNVLRLTDTLDNLGFEDSPAMLVYHVNFGYPLLDDGAKVYASARDVRPCDDFAAEGLHKYNLIEKPEIGRPEQCYFHTNELEAEGFAMLHNEKMGVAAIVRYDAGVFPLLCEWKCMRAGDYALGLEPTTAGVLGRAEARKQGLPMLKGGESRVYRLSIELTDDQGVIDGYIAKARQTA